MPFATLPEAKTNFTVRSINLRKGQQNSADYLLLNPKHKVPLLVVDGKPLTENVAIRLWIAAAHEFALSTFDRAHKEHLVSDDRIYPARPILAVSAAIFRNGKVLLVRRARPPALGVYTLPGGVIEAGETLTEAIAREVREETGLVIAPATLAGHREVITRAPDGRTERHFVILCFASRWVSGEVALNDELDDHRWLAPAGVESLKTTEGLAAIVAAAAERLTS